MKKPGFNRRTFLIGGMATSVVVIGLEWNWLKSLFDSVKPGPWNGLPVLSRSEWHTISCFADTVIPKTAGPSATESGVLQYLAKLFSDQLPVRRFGKAPVPLYARYSTYYRKLIARLDEISKREFGKAFYSLQAEERDRVLQELTTATHGQVGYRIVGIPPITEASDSDLFSLVRGHIVQGYFAEPKYGGNRDYRAWESIRHICHFNYPKDKSSCPPHVM